MKQWLWLILFSFSPTLFAFQTQYVSFEYPDGWKCELSQGVFFCQSTVEPDRKESIVMSIATIATEWDSLENYEKYLSTPRTIQDDAGNTLTTKVTYTRRRNINGFVWVDSLQYNSELPGFWARYLATVQNKLAILITYIVSDEFYPKLAPQFERMVASLKPNADFQLNVLSKQGDPAMPGATILGPKQQRDFLTGRLSVPKTASKEPKSNPQSETQSSPSSLLILIGVLAGAGIVFLRLRKKSRNAVKPKPGPPTKPS